MRMEISWRIEKEKGKGGKRKRKKNEVNEYDNEFGSFRIGKGRERTRK